MDLNNLLIVSWNAFLFTTIVMWNTLKKVYSNQSRVSKS